MNGIRLITYLIRLCRQFLDMTLMLENKKKVKFFLFYLLTRFFTVPLSSKIILFKT